MGKLIHLWILKKVLVAIKQPIIKLFGLGVILWSSTAILEDLARASVMPLWLMVVIKWSVLTGVFIFSWKLTKSIAVAIGDMNLIVGTNEKFSSRRQSLVDKASLLRRKDIIAKKYGKTRSEKRDSEIE